MQLPTHGTNTSDIEITNIDSHGFWIFIKGQEYFLPFEMYPWFKDARISDIVNVELFHESHIHWPALDIDLDVDCLRDPNSYPLAFR